MPAKTIDDYLADFSGDVRKKLLEMRALIKKHAPQAQEAMAYGIPTFKMNGSLVHFAGFKTHIGFYPTPSGIEAFTKQLSEYEHAKGSVNFPLSKPLPIKLIAEIVKFRVRENAGSAKEIATGVVHSIPADLRKTLITDKAALKLWNNLTPLSRNEWLCWVKDAKKSETRRNRIKRLRSELKEGKRRPCCWPGCHHRQKTRTNT
ncbi:MAG: YdeI/OmpD-associated family protein [Chitinispirillaceae bacterium]|jgi:uncharacterized protein YdhG (YjbR/CyaY superfamily)|nr:YdeI/OmpD-associated family protein [Chitinispirillaceae bacterium]